MIGLEFLRPELFALALAAVLIGLAGWHGLRRRRIELARLVEARRLASFLPGHSGSRSVARVVLAASAAVLLAVSATGPVRGHTLQEVVRRGVDVVVCLDTSRSMLARDLRPSRLERARREVLGLLEELEGDRVALLAFSGDSREVAPLTSDRTTLAGLLQYARPEDNRMGGTDLSATIEHALSLFDGRTGAHEAVVLLTDGEDLEGKAAETALEAAERGIKLYVVGVGTERGGKIPVVDAAGNESFLRGPDGEEVVTRLDGASLAQVAELTGGDYLSVENSPTPLQDLYRARISKLDGRELEDGMRRVPHDRYQWTLGLAAACMLIETGLRERRGRRRERS